MRSAFQRRRGIGASGLWVPGPAGGGGGDDIHTMPTGDLPGWRLSFSDNFDGYDYPVGSIVPIGSTYPGISGPAAATIGPKWGFYGNNVRTTHDGKVYPILSGEPGYLPPKSDGTPGAYHPAVVSKYWPTKTVSFEDGKARIWQHSEVINGVLTALGANLRPKIGTKYLLGPSLKYRFRMRHTEVIVNGVDQAAIGNYTTGRTNNLHNVPLAIDSNTWAQTHSEFDFPEHETNRAVAGNHHPMGPTNVTQHFETKQSPYEWHVADVEWISGVSVVYSLNGVSVFTSTKNVPTNPLVMVFQHEANWRQPIAGDSSVTEIDWAVVWERDTSITNPTPAPAGFGLGAFGTSPFGV